MAIWLPLFLAAITVKQDDTPLRSGGCDQDATVLTKLSAATKVEVKFSNYQKINGQQIPTTVTRLDDGNAVLSLNVASVGFDRWHRDGVFDAASNQ